MRIKIFGLVLAVLTGGIVFLSYINGTFSGIESLSEDLLFSSKPINKDIVIITIDDESINRIGQWPWPRKVFSDAFLKLNSSSPRVLGVDVIFAEPSYLGSEDDEVLAGTIGQVSYPIVFPVESSELILNKNSVAQAVNLLYPLDIFVSQKNLSLGHANIITDKDGVVRTFPLSIVGNEDGVDKEFPALAYEVAKKSGLVIPFEDNLKKINNIVFAAPPGVVHRIPFWRVLAGDTALLKNKIAFIGVFTADLHDSKPTPMGKEKEMPGVEIQANITNMLLMGYRLAPLSVTLTFFWIFLASLIPALIFIFSQKSIRPLLYNFVLGFFYLGTIIFLFQIGVVVNLVHITLAWLISTLVLFSYRHFVGEKEKRELKNVFSKYASREVVDEILKNPGQVKLGGQEKEITVFFSDIRGFTTWSEKTTPQKLVNILNRYFTAMSAEVLENGGVLDKYIGDAIMAFWGAPMDDVNQADKAMKAAVGMVQKLALFNQELAAEGEPEINIGIGLYTGPAIVGNVGSDQRFNYTAIGDTVNVASRLEGLTKEFKVKIVIGETTKNKIQDKYNFKFLGSVAVKGRNEPINIYTV